MGSEKQLKISNAKTRCLIYVRYIAEVLKTRSNLAAKFKVQLLPFTDGELYIPRGGCVMACRMQV